MYRVQLQQFEGPMDLLLFFIKRDEIDIYDIPVAQIADEYLRYVRLLEEIDLDGVGDFIYMAALLMNIKARMLLPSDAEGDEGEAVDPRRELVERLLEYVRYKDASERLATRRERRMDHFTRGEASSEREAVEERHDVHIDNSVYDLVQALGAALEAADEEERSPTHEVEPLTHTVEDQQAFVIETLATRSEVAFRSLVEQQSKGFVIATFLAILELARQHRLHIQVHESRLDFTLVGRDGPPLQPEDPATTTPERVSGDGMPAPNNNTE